MPGSARFLLFLVLALFASVGASQARPPQNQAEIDRYCERGPDGALMLKQCDVPEKNPIFDLILVILVGAGAAWVVEEARYRRTHYLDLQQKRPPPPK